MPGGPKFGDEGDVTTWDQTDTSAEVGIDTNLTTHRELHLNPALRVRAETLVPADDGDHEVMAMEIGLTVDIEMEKDMRLHGGRVSKCYQFWKTICRDRTVLKHVGGITIPFTEDVKCQTSRPLELRFSAKERRFVRDTLQDLVQTGCIVPLKQPKKNGWHSNIFLRPKRNGSYRMILNLKPE